MRRITLILVVLVFVAAPLLAHHGKDFLLVESYELPHTKALYAVSAEEAIFGRGTVTFRDEPSLLLGLTGRVAAEVHVHIEKEPGRSARLAAIAPAVHARGKDGTVVVEEIIPLKTLTSARSRKRRPRQSQAMPESQSAAGTTVSSESSRRRGRTRWRSLSTDRVRHLH